VRPATVSLLLLATTTPPALGQSVTLAHPSVPLRTLSRPQTPAGKLSWARPVASLIIPGSGQFLAGQDRGLLYVAAEALFFARFLADRGQGVREGDRFRELAFTVARGDYHPAARDTTFEYFEQMGKYIESGPYDEDPGPAFVPPTDERTFNGAIWALARRTFLPDTVTVPDPESEEYLRALEFYRERAVGPNFQWSWRNAGLEQDLFRQTIRSSDEAFRRATTQLGLVLANHLLSAIDAFISLRLSSTLRPMQVSTVVWRRPGDSGLRWTSMLSISF
jgi:hypothetical protein